MIEAVVRALIGICVIVLCVFLCTWVLAELGIAIPAMVIKIIWIIAVLLIILYLVRLLRPHLGSLWP